MPVDMAPVCSEDGVFIQIFQGMVRKWVDMGIIRVLRRMHSNPILALLAISQLAKVDWGVPGVEWFPFDYERSRFFFIPPVPGMKRIREDGSDIIKDSHDEIRPDCRVAFADRGMLHVFAERLGSCFLKKATTILSIRCWRNKTA